MQEEIQAIKDLMDREVGEGRDEPQARTLADTYVANNPTTFDQMRTMTIQDLVRSVDILREAGMDEDRWKVEIWLLHHFEPLNVGGSFQPTIRIPGEV